MSREGAQIFVQGPQISTAPAMATHQTALTSPALAQPAPFPHPYLGQPAMQQPHAGAMQQLYATGAEQAALQQTTFLPTAATTAGSIYDQWSNRIKMKKFYPSQPIAVYTTPCMVATHAFS